MRANQQRNYAADDRKDRGKEIEEQCPARLKSCVQQNKEVAQLVRNLMAYDGYRGRNSDRRADQIGHTDNHSVNKIVCRVCCEIHVTNRMDMIIGLQNMLVLPQEKLLQNKEAEHPS